MAIRVKAADVRHLLGRGAPPPSPRRYLLPYPPSQNKLWRPGLDRRGRPQLFLTSDGRAYRREVAAAVLLAGAAFHAGQVAVHIDAYPPDRRARDCDNVLGCLDALTKAGLWADDSQIRHLSVTMRPPRKPGRLEVTVASWAEGEG